MVTESKLSGQRGTAGDILLIVLSLRKLALDGV